MMQLKEAFFGGSRVYGTPRPDSDLDMVVLVDDLALGNLIQVADSCKSHSNGTTSLRFGELNLVATTDSSVFAAWRLACLKLIKEAPVSKLRACQVHYEVGATNELKLEKDGTPTPSMPNEQ